MMYGFGDAQHPLKDTVSAVEDAVVDYIVSMVCGGCRLLPLLDLKPS
jgi:hypothetical protein